MKATQTLLLWSLIVSLGGFLFGFDTAVISGAEQQIQTILKLTPFWHGVTISSALAGTVVGAFSAGKPADIFGRKPLLFIIAILYLVSAIGSALAGSVSSLIFYRFIGGIGVGASSVVAPLFISEISPAKSRGRMTALFQFNVISGILVAYVSNYLLKDAGSEPWRWMLGIEAVPALIYLILLVFIPESPRFLVKKGREAEAAAILRKTTSDNVDIEIESIRRSVSGGGLKDRLFSKKYIKPISIAFLVAMFNQLAGINAILYYAPRIFAIAGFSESDSLFQSIMIGITNAIFTTLGVLIIDRLGRKKLLMIGSIGMSICLAMVSYTYFSGEFEGYLLLIYILTYMMFFASSTGAVIWVLIAEVFPNSVRGTGQSLGSFTHWFFAALITFLFPIIVKTESGPSLSFLFFAIMMIVQFIVVWLYFPETKGRTLEELEKQLS